MSAPTATPTLTPTLNLTRTPTRTPTPTLTLTLTQAPGAAEAELGLEEALALLRRECADEAALADALQALLLLCANVVAHPEDQRFRTIRLLNAHFQATVARHRGGLEVLRALGFVERRSVEDDELWRGVHL